jgi:hypothetical protein
MDPWLTISIRTHDDQAHIGSHSMNGADQRKGEALSVEADQGESEFLVSQELRQFEHHKLNTRMILEEGDEPLHADGLWLKERHP